MRVWVQNHCFSNSSMNFWRFWHWRKLPLQCTVKTIVPNVVRKRGAVVSNNIYCKSMWQQPRRRQKKNRSVIFQEMKPINLFKISFQTSCLFCFPFGLSWICSVWQREATYLLRLVRPYRVRGGGDKQDRGGGRVELWNCGKRHSAALRGRERGVGGGGRGDGRRSALQRRSPRR